MNLIIVLAAVISFGLSAGTGYFLIPFLKKLKYGQTILDIGPSWHKSKQGTPTMGGIMFIIGVTVSSLFALALFAVKGAASSPENHLETVRLIAGLVLALSFGALGFIDDYVKVVKKRNLGLTARQKIVAQIFIALCYLLIVYLGGDRRTEVWFPFIGSLDFGLFYYPFAAFVIIGFVNAVNLTDGIDGLAASVTFFAALSLMAVSAILKCLSMNMLSAVLAGGCLGFLLYNFHPAKVFMGDTGSMFLGGAIVAIAFGVGQPLLLVFAGIIYLIEAGSVMLQVSYFKLTHGKRIFKMSPIHHHFEMSGWSEVKIVVVFSIVTLIGGALAVLSVISMVK